MTARDDLRDCFLSDSRDRFEAAADAFRAEVLNEAAAGLVAYCPDHGDRDTSYMSCHCPAADDLRRTAGAGEPRPKKPNGMDPRLILGVWADPAEAGAA